MRFGCGKTAKTSDRSSRSRSRPRHLLLDPLAGELDQPVVLDARRTRGEAGHAAEAAVEVLGDRAVQLDRPLDRRLHQPDPAARRVHLLVPELVGRARRQAEAAVHAVARSARRPSDEDARRGRRRRAHARRAATRRAPAARPRRRCPDPGGRARTPARRRLTAAGARPGATPLSAQTASPPSRPGTPRAWRVDRGPQPFEEQREPARREEVDRGRLERRAAQLLPERRAGRRSPTRPSPRQPAAGAAERDPRDQPEPAARAGEELAEVVAGDVLHHLAARARDRAVGEHDGDADHEVAHRAEAMPQRPGEVARQAGSERRVARRVEREHLPVPGRAAPAAPTAASPPRRSRSGRPARARGRRLSAAVERMTSPPSRSIETVPPAASTSAASLERLRLDAAQRRSARPARSSGCIR